MHIHDDHGVCTVANNNVVWIFGQQMHRVNINTSSSRGSNGFESIEAFSGFCVPQLDSAIGGSTNQLMSIQRTDDIINVGGVSPELFQSFTRLESMSSHGGVKGRTDNLRIVLTEHETRDSLAMSLFKLS